MKNAERTRVLYGTDAPYSTVQYSGSKRDIMVSHKNVTAQSKTHFYRGDQIKIENNKGLFAP